MAVSALIDSLVQDVRYGVRQLRLSPGFTIVAVLSLALGIGANTAIFQLMNAVRLRALPVEKPEELLEVRLPPGSSRSGRFTGGRSNLTYPQWEQIRARQEAFSGIFAWSTSRLNLSIGGEPRYAEGLWVSGDFFRTLGVQPELGRLISADDDKRGCGNAGAVLSHSFWVREFAADPGVLSRTVTLDSHVVPVIGVAAPGFFGVEVGRRFDVAVPLCSRAVFEPEEKPLDKRWYWWLAVMGRVKSGWPLERVNAHLGSLAPGLFEATLPENYQPDMAKRYLASKLVAQPAARGVSSLRARYENPLWMLMATAGLVLLIACANIANLMLARATQREREFAVRLALGASRPRLIRQVLAESLMLALAGTILGAGLAQFLSRSLVAFLRSGQQSLFLDAPLDWRVLGFAAGIAALTCVLFGLAPALRAVRIAPGAAMKAGSRGLTASRERFGVRRILVVAQVALCLVLLTGSLLFLGSLRNLLSVDPGFRAEGLLSASIGLPREDYPPERRAPLHREMLERLRAIPVLDSIAEVVVVPVSGSGWNQTVRVDAETGPYRESYFNRVGPGYFKTMGTRLLAGREIDARDTLESPKVAIVNEAFAQRFFNSGNPVGHRLRVEPERGKPEASYEIVGVVRDSKYYGLRDEFQPTTFLAAGQDDQPGTFVQYAIRSRGSLEAATSAIKQTLREVNPKAAVDFRVLDAQIRDSLLRERLMATLTGFFGALAVLIAVVGLYGVISYMVASRKGEIGIRMALGAGRGAIVRMVLREACLLLALGLAIGAAASRAAAQTLSSLLFGVTAGDAATLALAVGGLAAVALAASYVPARRASSVEPMLALREE
jgi:putative ABC transport system permease protein